MIYIVFKIGEFDATLRTSFSFSFGHQYCCSTAIFLSLARIQTRSVCKLLATECVLSTVRCVYVVCVWGLSRKSEIRITDVKCVERPQNKNRTAIILLISKISSLKAQVKKLYKVIYLTKLLIKLYIASPGVEGSRKTCDFTPCSVEVVRHHIKVINLPKIKHEYETVTFKIETAFF